MKLFALAMIFTGLISTSTQAHTKLDNVSFSVRACLVEPAGVAEPIQVDENAIIGTLVRDLAALQKDCINPYLQSYGLKPVCLRRTENRRLARLTVRHYIHAVARRQSTNGRWSCSSRPLAIQSFSR